MTTGALIWVVVAMVAGRMAQLYLTYQQSMAFNDRVRPLRAQGTVSVGLGGRRYRGGRAFVAIAVDPDTERVVDALSLQGLTTFARARTARGLVGQQISDLAGDREVPGITAPQRLAARQAAELYRHATTRTTAETPRDGSEVAA